MAGSLKHGAMKECQAVSGEAPKSLVLCSENMAALGVGNLKLYSSPNNLYYLRFQFGSYRKGGYTLV